MRRLMICCVALAVLLSVLGRAQAGPINGTMFYTTFLGGKNVHKVDFAYNGVNAFVLSNNLNIASTPGADGIVFTSDGFLAVGGQSNFVHRVNPSNGAFTSQNTGPGDRPAFHMSVTPSSSIIAAGIPGGPVRFNSTLTNNGTPLTHSGGLDNVVDTIVFDRNGQGWYTSSGPGGIGSFGKIDFIGDTFTTTRTMTNVPAAHGAAFDSFSDTIILFGSNHISQVNPYTGGTSLLHDLVVGNGTFDQGAASGKGHIFAANNDGFLTFIDFSSTSNVATADFISTQFLANSLDDVAPLSGLGAPTSVPEPSSLTMLCLGSLGLAVCCWRRREKAALVVR